MITDAERKAALLALETLQNNLQKDSLLDDEDITKVDLNTVLNESIKELQTKDVVEGSY